MYEITKKIELASKMKLLEINAPDIARKAKPGQFLIVMTGETCERVPLHICGFDVDRGTVAFAFNEVGKSTTQLGRLRKGYCVWNVTGPLGIPSEIRKFGRVLCVSGGVMTAPMLLQVKELKDCGNDVTVVVGARSKDLLIFEDKMKCLTHDLYVVTDDSSKGYSSLGFLKQVLGKEKFDRCITMGPVVMMRTVSELTKPQGIKTLVTLTPIMIDGMGMCGVCRVSVGGKMKFACVDGPEFDGHSVDFDELVNRQRIFLPEERLSSILWEKTDASGRCLCAERKL